MRKRHDCVARLVVKRTALALLLANPALPFGERASAAEDAPVLHVTEQVPDLASVEMGGSQSDQQARTPSSPRQAAPRPIATQLAHTSGGWVARETIGKEAPLRDPAILPPNAKSDQAAPIGGRRTDKTPVAEKRSSEHEPASESPASEIAPQGDTVESSDAEIERSSEPVEESGDATGSISLKSLQPVPLMAPQSSNNSEAPQAGEPTNPSSEISEQPATIEPSDRERHAALPVRRPAITAADRTANSAPFDDNQPIFDEVQSALPDSVAATEAEDSIEAKDAAEVERLESAKPVAPVVSAAVARLQRPLEQCLNYYYQRPENAAERSSWGMMHSIMVYGVDTQVIGGRKRYNAIAWLAGNNICRGQRLLSVGRDGGIVPRQGVGVQGHQGQFLAVLGLVGVPSDYPLYVDRRKFAVEDLIAHEQRECRRGEELTFTLIALAHYIDTDSEWRSKDGETWDFERLIQEELAQPVIGAACGGTHRLMGLSHALRIRKAEGHPITGQWARADTFIEEFTDYAWKLQNRDGSMSTNWFEGRGDNGNIDRKIQTTGHIVEWMLAHATDDQLQDERLVRAVRFLTAAMSSDPGRDKEIGPKGHALRSLAVYHQRMFGAPAPWNADGASNGSSATAQRRSSSHR